MIIPIIICNQGASDVVGHRWPRRVWRSHQVLLSWSTGTIKMIMLYMLINHIDALTKFYYREAQVGKCYHDHIFYFAVVFFHICHDHDDSASCQVLLLQSVDHHGIGVDHHADLCLYFLFLHLSFFLSFFLSFQACVFAFSTTDHSSLLAVRKWRKKVKRTSCWTTKITQKMTFMPPSGSFKLWTRKWWGGEGRVA